MKQIKKNLEGMMKTEPKLLGHIPVRLPKKMIYARLGYNIHHTSMTGQQAELIENTIMEGFALCEAKGIWCRLPVTDRGPDFIEFGNMAKINSQSLARLLTESHDILLMAATVGPAIMDRTAKEIEKKNGSAAIILDAVGGQTADAAVDWINDYVRQLITRNREKLTKRRFSPGYGDLGLENQKTVFEILRLENLGLKLTERFMLIPEKSVIAIAGIEKAFQS